MRLLANSMPKSGTYLLSRLPELLGFRRVSPGLNGALIRYSSLNPFHRWKVSRRRLKAGTRGSGFEVDLDNPGLRINQDSLHKILSAVPEQSFVQCHLPYSPELALFLSEMGFHFLHILRDPRDALLSYVNHMLRDPKYPFHSLFTNLGDDEERLMTVLKGAKGRYDVVLAPLAVRISRSIPWIKSPNVCTLKFDEMVGAKGGGSDILQIAAVKRATEYLGLNLGESDINRVAGNLFYIKAKTFHKGQIGAWRDNFSPSFKKLFMEECNQYLVEMGYE